MRLPWARREDIAGFERLVLTRSCSCGGAELPSEKEEVLWLARDGRRRLDCET